MDSTLNGLIADVPDDRPMLYCGERTISFGEFRDAAARVSGGLRAMGYERGDVLALWLPTIPEWLVLCFAAARIGVSVAALNTRYRAKELRDVLGASRAKGIALPVGFLDVDYEEILREAAVGSLDVIRVPELPAGEPVHDEGKPADIAAIFTTSGTTGVPKLPTHTQGAVVHHARNAARAFGIAEGDAVLCALPLAGVFGFCWALGAAAAGAPCVLVPIFDADEVADQMRRHEVTHFTGADNMLRAVLERPGPFGRWRAGGFANFTGGSLDLVRLAEERAGVRLVGLYGISEIFALVSCRDPGDPPERRSLAGGTVISPEIEIRAVDPGTGSVLAHGEHGELQVRGYNVMAGYLHNPEATAQAVTDDGWYRTGDLGYTERDGSFVFLSRMKDSLRLRGFLVDPLEIEEFLNRHEAVRYAQVVGAPGEKGDVAVAFVQTNAGAVLREEDLRAFCASGMANYKVPSRIVFVESFPTVSGPNGEKVQKTRLREMAIELTAAN